MTPRYQPDFTREQARLVAEAAGLDTSVAIDEQLGGDGGLEAEVASLTARVAKLTDQLEAQQADLARDFQEKYAKALGDSRSPWFNADGSASDGS